MIPFLRAREGTLVVQTGYMGDVMLTTPLLSALAERHGPVDVVATPASASLLDTHPAVRRVIRYDKRGADRGWDGIRRVGRELRRAAYARAFLPHRSWRSAMLVFLARVPERTGFEDSPAARLYTRKVPRPVQAHETARLAALAAPPEGMAPPPVSLGITYEDHAEAERWLAAHDVTGPYIVLGAGGPWGAKRWPHFAELAARLPLPSVVIGGPTDETIGAAIEAGAPGRARSACGQVGPRTSAALIQRAALLVTNDSSPLHLALATSTPMVALFGPTVPAAGLGPMHAHDVVLGHEELLCRPCSAFGPAVCPLEHHRCLRELPVERVLEAVVQLLSRRKVVLLP